MSEFLKIILATICVAGLDGCKILLTAQKSFGEEMKQNTVP